MRINPEVNINETVSTSNTNAKKEYMKRLAYLLWLLSSTVCHLLCCGSTDNCTLLVAEKEKVNKYNNKYVL